jgi:hypothetical protein
VGLYNPVSPDQSHKGFGRLGKGGSMIRPVGKTLGEYLREKKLGDKRIELVPIWEKIVKFPANKKISGKLNIIFDGDISIKDLFHFFMDGTEISISLDHLSKVGSVPSSMELYDLVFKFNGTRLKYVGVGDPYICIPIEEGIDPLLGFDMNVISNLFCILVFDEDEMGNEVEYLIDPLLEEL